MNNKRNIIRVKSKYFKLKLEKRKQEKRTINENIAYGIYNRRIMTPQEKYKFIEKNIPHEIAEPYLKSLSEQILEIEKNRQLEELSEYIGSYKMHQIIHKEEEKFGLDDKSISHHFVKYAPSILWIFSVLIVIYIFLLATKTI